MTTNLHGGIRAFLFTHSITQKELAESIGVTQAAINSIINKGKRPNPETMAKLYAVVKKVDPVQALELVIYQLEDELSRYGVDRKKITLRAAKSKSADKAQDKVLSDLERIMRTNEHVYMLCKDLATAFDDNTNLD